MDDNKIKWVRNKERFPYVDSKNKERFYTPDFYLIDEDLFLEVKGYRTDLYVIKWSQFNKNLEIWDKNVLKSKKII